MKDVLKGLAVKILSFVLLVAVLAAGGYLLYRHFTGKFLPKAEHEAITNVDLVREQLETTAELNTGSYLCTVVLTKSDSKKIKDWKIPFTEKNFAVSYDGTVKAGIKDLTQAKVEEDGDTIIVKLPEVEITGVEIDNSSFQVLDESNNIFNSVKLEDLNDAQIELKEEMTDKALDKGLLEIAKSNAELVIEGMLASPTDEYKIKVEWQK